MIGFSLVFLEFKLSAVVLVLVIVPLLKEILLISTELKVLTTKYIYKIIITRSLGSLRT